MKNIPALLVAAAETEPGNFEHRIDRCEVRIFSPTRRMTSRVRWMVEPGGIDTTPIA